MLMLPGDSIENQNFNNIVSDIALLQSLGIRLVVVHGARRQIEKQLSDAKLQTEIVNGWRITTREQLPHILSAIELTRLKLESAFSTGLPNSPLYGAKIRVRSGNFVTAMPIGVLDGVDYQLTGKVRSIDSEGVKQIIENGSIALVSPLGFSVSGEIFNVGFDDIAVETALAINADKLIVYNDDGPIYDDAGKIYREMTLLKCEKFLVKHPKKSSNNTYFSLKACRKACDGGVSRAHVISSNEDGALLKELFTRDGAGTMVYRDSYEAIRRARFEDVSGILNLLKPLEDEGILVRRSRELLEREIACFTVMEKDSVIIGCAALYPFSQANSGELACVAIHTDYRNGGRAKKLLTHLERQAQRLKMQHLFVLTTQAAHWFLEQGFIETVPSILPVERKALYNFQRKSKVFVKDLSS